MEAAGVHHIVYSGRGRAFTIFNLSDIHIGNRATHMSAFREDV